MSRRLWPVALLATTLSAVAAEPVRITDVAAPAAGVYDRTLVLYFTVNFSAPVFVQGAPRLTIDVGGAARHATVISSLSPSPAGQRQLMFEYSPGPNDEDADGIRLGHAIDLNNGAIVAADGSAARTTFTTPDTRGISIAVARPPTPRILGVDFGSSSNGEAIVLRGTADAHSLVLVNRTDLGLLGATLATDNGWWTFEYVPTAGKSFEFSATAENLDGILSLESAPFRVTPGDARQGGQVEIGVRNEVAR